jgi:hypothetical protein
MFMSKVYGKMFSVIKHELTHAGTVVGINEQRSASIAIRGETSGNVDAGDKFAL